MGEYLDDEGYTRRVGISLGPQYGTVGPEQIKESAKEALKGCGVDVLLVCGFAFDLAMVDTLLNATGAGNLCTVFGEPDVTIESTSDGLVVEIRGVDVYDPHHPRRTGEQHRRHRLLAARLGVRRGELLRPARLLHRRRRSLSTRTRGRRCTGHGHALSRARTPARLPSR
jgi:hypothetical protein